MSTLTPSIWVPSLWSTRLKWPLMSAGSPFLDPALKPTLTRLAGPPSNRGSQKPPPVTKSAQLKTWAQAFSYPMVTAPPASNRASPAIVNILHFMARSSTLSAQNAMALLALERMTSPPPARMRWRALTTIDEAVAVCSLMMRVATPRISTCWLGWPVTATGTPPNVSA